MKSRWLVAPVVACVAFSGFVACSAQPGDHAEESPSNESADATSPVVQVTSETAVLTKATRPTRANGIPYGVKPRRDPTAFATPAATDLPFDHEGPELPPTTADGTGTGRFHDDVTPTCNNPKLAYFGGPLLQSPVIVPVFWSSNVNVQLTANMPQFFADVTLSSYWAWLTEYDSVGLSPGSNQAILPGSATAGVTLTPSRCPGTANCTVSDAQIQAELTAQINAGTLPKPVTDCTGNTRTVYMIEFPPNVKVTGPSGAGNSCVQFCAYHNTGTFSGIPLVYGVLMDEFTAACKTGCGGNATGLENSTDTASHELIEATTDPDIGLDLQAGYAAPAGWGDNSNQCGEIGDICDQNVAGDTITVSGRTWVVQEMWSNKQNKCTSTGTPLPVCVGTTSTTCRPCACGDDGIACNGATSVCESSSTNGKVGACVQCTATDTTPCGATGTCASDDTCSCTPTTSCPAGDNCGTVSDGCSGTLNCGTCTSPQSCGGGTPSIPNVCGCTPATTCPGGKNCGTAGDGCGGTINCGTCASPQTCGGGGASGVCGCTPTTTCPAGDNCGTAPNGCGGTVNCGTCGTPETCGGGTPSTPNVCGCTPSAACPAGQTCGTSPDGCGGTLVCGSCGAPQTCGGAGVAGVCGCTPLAACPAGYTCGSVTDGCGGTLTCGTCAGPQTCGGGTPANPNACGCTPVASCPAGQMCGLAPDTCGGTIACGTCGAGQTCNASNQCVAVVVDAGVDSGHPVDASTHDGSAGDASARDGGAGTDGATDGMAGHDAALADTGLPRSDGGSGHDASQPHDAKVEDARTSRDASTGSHHDSGVVSTADSGPLGDATGDAAGEVGQTGGCGCRTVPTKRVGAPSVLLLLLPLALVGRRRQRRARAAT